MVAKVQNWGNSLAVRLPRTVARELGLSNGSSIELTLEHGLILLKPVNTKEQELSLKLEAITYGNRHGEVDFGGSAGMELL